MSKVYTGESRQVTVRVKGDVSSNKLQVWLCLRKTVVDKYSNDILDEYKDIHSVEYNSTEGFTEIKINLEYTDTSGYPEGYIDIEVVQGISDVDGFVSQYRKIGRAERAITVVSSVSGGV